jgi:DNA-binding transcriptional ArsR family regulator
MNLLPMQPSCCDVLPPADAASKCAALSHPVRIEILARVAGRGACSCKDVVACLDLAQSTVSQHLRILVDAGLLNFASEGQRSRYQVNSAAMAALSAELSQFADACCREPER